jgi:uncharacterized membrane protein
MAKKSFASLSEYFFKHRILFLLVAILGLIIGGPFTGDLFIYGVIPDVLMTIIFTAGIYSISNQKKQFYIALALAVPMYMAIWSSHLLESVELFLVGAFFAAFFTGFLISQLIKFIFNQKDVTQEVIFAAVVVYLLMAIVWSFSYWMLDYFYPQSLSFPDGPAPNVYRYLYFSFVTITTLGYGDVSPLTQKAASLVILEAVTGQIYLVVVVAWLVGMHVSRRSRSK